ncbi:hypothetical protein DPEC_G00063970 [Dallia pectoralis]|uniref:Uncharacterized protein n=1 Tax=Dallia pectoralis TaxID=75939 RepID=A0ACC2H885_DALPE|nr:hypothetical protein DPEC_G00063970 [Dallia pectoralis]
MVLPEWLWLLSLSSYLPLSSGGQERNGPALVSRDRTTLDRAQERQGRRAETDPIKSPPEEPGRAESDTQREERQRQKKGGRDRRNGITHKGLALIGVLFKADLEVL